MRIAIAEFKQETNSFVPFTTTVKTFEEQYLYRGEEIFTAFGSARLEVPGALDALKEAGAQAVPLLATMAMASGTVERASFDILMNEILERLRAAGSVDGVYRAAGSRRSAGRHPNHCVAGPARPHHGRHAAAGCGLYRLPRIPAH